MTSVSRRKFLTSVLQASTVCFISSLSPSFAASRPDEGEIMTMMSKPLKLDKENNWGKRRVEMLRSLVMQENCDHLELSRFSQLSWHEKINAVNTHINSMPYITDQQQFNREDVWVRPHDFFEHGGDCEDFALAKFNYLAAGNIAPERLFILGLTSKSSSQAHASLGILENGNLLILDNRRNKPYREQEYTQEFNLAYALNIHGLWQPIF